MKNLTISLILVTVSVSSHAMLSRASLQLLKRSTDSYIYKARLHKIATEIDKLELSPEKSLLRMIVAIPGGQLYGILGTFWGTLTGFVTGFVPALIVGESEPSEYELFPYVNKEIIAFTTMSGAAVGSILAGTYGAYSIGGKHGVIVCAMVTAALAGVRSLKYLENEKKKKIANTVSK